MRNVRMIAALTVAGLVAGTGLDTVSAQSYTDPQSASIYSTAISYDPILARTVSYADTITASPTDLQIASADTLSLSSGTTFIRASSYPTTFTTSSTDYLRIASADSLTLHSDPTFIRASSYPTLYSTGITPTRTIVAYTPPVTNAVENGATVNAAVITTNTLPGDPLLSFTKPINPVVYSNLPSISANLSVNDRGIVYVPYGGSETLKWESYGTSSCSVDPIGQSGTQGQYLLQDITSNTVITLSCEAAPGFRNYQIFPSWVGRVEVKVLPPTFGYLKDHVSQMTASGGKKANLTSTKVFIDQAQKAYDSGKTDKARSFLQKSVSDIAKRAGKAGYSAASVSQYDKAVEYLIKTLPVKVAIASDGCSVTATGPAGLILEHGANYQMRKGYGLQTTIPESGTVTESLYASDGWTATAEVVDSDGLIYARDTKDGVAGGCPGHPAV